MPLGDLPPEPVAYRPPGGAPPASRKPVRVGTVAHRNREWGSGPVAFVPLPSLPTAGRNRAAETYDGDDRQASVDSWSMIERALDEHDPILRVDQNVQDRGGIG